MHLFYLNFGARGRVHLAGHVLGHLAPEGLVGASGREVGHRDHEADATQTPHLGRIHGVARARRLARVLVLAALALGPALGRAPLRVLVLGHGLFLQRGVVSAETRGAGQLDDGLERWLRNLEDLDIRDGDARRGSRRARREGQFAEEVALGQRGADGVVGAGDVARALDLAVQNDEEVLALGVLLQDQLARLEVVRGTGVDDLGDFGAVQGTEQGNALHGTCVEHALLVLRVLEHLT